MKKKLFLILLISLLFINTEANEVVKKNKTFNTEMAIKKKAKRCKAITKKKTQCKRNAEPGSDYCWQHSPKR